MRSSQWIKAPRNKRYQRKSAKCAGNIIARITQITQILNYDPRSLVRDCFVGRPDWHRYARLARTARGRSRERLSKTLWLLQPQPMSALQFPTYNAVIVSGTKWSEAIPWFKKHVTPTDYVAGSLVRDCFVGRPDCRRYVRLARTAFQGSPILPSSDTSSYKSFHSGLNALIRPIFFWREPAFSCFSLPIASPIS